MKKLFAFFIMFLLALASATYFYYNHWRSEQQTEETLPHIPQSAALVYEVANFGKQWAYFQQTPMAKTCNQLPAFVAIQQGINLINELIASPQSLDGVPLTVSVHALSEEHIGYIFYVNTNDVSTQVFLNAIMAKTNQDRAYNTTVRKYLGYKLTEIRKRGTTQSLSYIKHNAYIIASCSSLLIEDVVRNLANKQPTSFIALKRTANPQGSLYVNFSHLSQLLRIFIRHGHTDAFDACLATFSLASHFNLKLTHNHLLLSGSTPKQETTSPYFTHTLVGQTAGPLLLAPYLPQNTAMLQHFTFSDAEQLLATFQQYRPLSQSDILPEIQDFNLLTGMLYPLLQGEISHCTLACGHNQQENQLVFVKVKDTQSFIEALEGASLLASLPSSETNQAQYKTFKLTKDYFAYWLPGHLFPKFNANYITQVDDYIILANSLTGLQKWYAQYYQNKTWAYTLPKTTWLASMLDQAHFSLLVDLQKIWPQVLHALKPAWQPLFETHANVFQEFQHASLQLLHEQDESCYMSILLNHQTRPSISESHAHQGTENKQCIAQDTLSRAAIFQTEAPMINRPWLVKSHRTKEHHILLQDALYQLYFLDSSGKLLWKKALEGPITTNLFEVDYYNNNKTQYLFATDKQVHLLDYHGRNISRYPHLLDQPNQSVSLQVVDYNDNKDYHFLIATTQGDVYLKDKHCRPFPAWNPHVLGQSFAGTPFHIKVQGKDYFLALQTNGTLQVLNRKGQVSPGFPIHFNTPVHNPLLVHKGKTTQDTTALVVLTDTGQLIHLNMAGHIRNTLQLDYLEGTTRFVLCPNQVTGHAYVILQQDGDKVKVLDETTTLLFELQDQAKNVLLQYYDFGSGYRFYVLTDKENQLTSLYDHTGKLLHDTPWRNGNEVSLLFSASDKQWQIYMGFDKLLYRYILNMPDILRSDD